MFKLALQKRLLLEGVKGEVVGTIKTPKQVLAEESPEMTSISFDASIAW